MNAAGMLICPLPLKTSLHSVNKVHKFLTVVLYILYESIINNVTESLTSKDQQHYTLPALATSFLKPQQTW